MAAKLNTAAVRKAIKAGKSFAEIARNAGGKQGDGTYNAVRKLAAK